MNAEGERACQKPRQIGIDNGKQIPVWIGGSITPSTSSDDELLSPRSGMLICPATAQVTRAYIVAAALQDLAGIYM